MGVLSILFPSIQKTPCAHTEVYFDSEWMIVPTGHRKVCSVGSSPLLPSLVRPEASVTMS